MRACPVFIMAERRWIAVENASLYRDALGVACPSDIPENLLNPVEHAVTELLHRYARMHGPFLSHALTQRYGLALEVVEQELQELERQGVLVRGELRADLGATEWCEADVLRRLKRRTLAKLRRELAPVEPAALAMFLIHWHGLGSERTGTERLLEIVAQLEGVFLPWSLLSRVLLPMRMRGFSLDLLNQLAASGTIVWIGSGALGMRDGRIGLFRRAQLARLLPPPQDFAPNSEIATRILSHLRERGACFSFEIEEYARRSLPGLESGDFDAALWDLVWAGQISNDSFDLLRHIGPRARAQRVGRRAGHKPVVGGRWFLVEHLTDRELADTERIFAQTQVLLERYGIVNRELSNAEELQGGFGPVYRVLKSMGEAARVRRGYFVEGLPGAQFGLQGAIDRLRGLGADRSKQASGMVLLAALDPANAYGALLKWPACSDNSTFLPRRAPAAWLLLAGGCPVLYAAANGRRVYTFEPALAPLGRHTQDCFRALCDLPRLSGRSHLLLEEIDGIPVESSPYYQTLREVGFVRDYRGLTLSR
jgi:ATP-dependent Lhr-like helicase